MTFRPAERALQAATTNQPALACELEALCTPGLGHFISVLAEGAQCCGNSFGGNQIPEPILAVALKKGKMEKKNCFSNIWFPNIFICNSKSTDHMHYICSGLELKQGL